MSTARVAKDSHAGFTAAEPVVRIDSEVTRRIRQHARAHSKTEVCGVLIGSNDAGAIDIRASIEGVNAAQAGTHVTFTQDAWEAIYRVKDELYSDERIVGWYHSHPGFGVFLSEHDLFIQQNFFSSPGQVAWVYDPHTDEEGCFGWVGGEIHRITQLAVEDRNGDGTERTPKSTDSASADDVEDAVAPPPQRRTARHNAPPRWAQLAGVALSHLSALALGFAVAYFLCPFVIYLAMNPMTGQPIVLKAGHVLLVPGLDKFSVPSDPAAMQDHPPAPASPGQRPSGSASAPATSPQPSVPPKPSQAGGHP